MIRHPYLIVFILLMAFRIESARSQPGASPAVTANGNLVILDCLVLREMRVQSNSFIGAENFERIGDQWFARGEYRRAIDCYDESIRISPGKWTAYGSRGRAWFEIIVVERAVADLTEAIRLLSENSVVDPFQMSIFYHYRGMAWGFSQYLHRAMDDYNDAIRFDPGNFGALVSRGTHRLVAGQRVQAIADFTEALRLNPRLAVAYRNRGIAHEEIGDLALALIDLRSALRLVPNDADAQRAIARVEARIDALHNPRR